MSQREPTEREKRIINRVALKEYEKRVLMRHSVLTRFIERGEKNSREEPIPEFRLPYPESDIDESITDDTTRKSSHELLTEFLGGKCKVCGSATDLEIHHIVPLAKGGQDTSENLVVLCRECHVKTF